MKKDLRKLRKDANLSMYQLAVKLGVSPGSITNWEHGESNPSADSIYNMSKLYGLTTDDIFLALHTTKIVNNKKKQPQ